MEANRPPLWTRLLVWVGALTMVLAAGTAATAQYFFHRINSSLESEDILGQQRRTLDAVDLEGPLNFLILGRDKDAHGLTRTDTIIIAHVDDDLSQVSLVSIPRDLWVRIPDCGSGHPCEGKINSATASFSERERQLESVNATLFELTGLRFHGAAIADFEGFLDLIDVVGKIELCPWHEITTDHLHKTYPGECARYGKKDALEIVRERKAWSTNEDWNTGRGGDYGRQAMQQQAIMAILEAAKEQGYHRDPVKASEILAGFGDNLSVDLGDLSIADFIVAMRHIDPSEIARYRVPSEPGYAGGSSVVLMNEYAGHTRAAEKLWRSLEEGTLAEWGAAHPEWVNR
ncbi:LCP family protein [Salininema proteolyticum]|uniref:LCP family protein n=1 Tax=Salininema proteolyticum TaxID=1607685 RepID=A0ABV8U1X6_9ACTN